MSMGRRGKGAQGRMWIESSAVTPGPGHPFYERLNRILDKHEFDKAVEELCAPFYAATVGRPSMPPGVYVRLLLIGYFEGIDSERGIAWRVADSLALRRFLGYAVDERTPEHSTMSRTRQRIDMETHRKVFAWVLSILAKEKLLKGKTIGVDATTLEANAALRSIVRRDTGESYEEFLTGLAKASGIETPTREDLARIDKNRPGKGSNQDWEHPHDPDAKITKMKDGRTHLAHKAEHVIDMETNAVVAVTLQSAAEGDTKTLPVSIDDAVEHVNAATEDPDVLRQVSPQLFAEVLTDKGYHSNDSLVFLEDSGFRTYVSEPKRGRRNWEDKAAEQQATYANRRRIRGERGKRLQRRRGEILERTHAHLYETGGMRRTHLRGHPNILKRLLLHVCGFNLGLVMRKLFGFGTPRALQGLLDALFRLARTSTSPASELLARFLPLSGLTLSAPSRFPPICWRFTRLQELRLSTGC